MIYGWDSRPMRVAIGLIILAVACCTLSLVFAVVGVLAAYPLNLWFGCASIAIGLGGFIAGVIGIIGFCIEYTEKK